MNSDFIQRRVLISGRVQGVGFRNSLMKEAMKESVNEAVKEAMKESGNFVRGFVRNLEDGRVEAVLLGPPEKILELTAWCKHGPVHAKVTSLEVKEESPDLSLGQLKIL